MTVYSINGRHVKIQDAPHPPHLFQLVLIHTYPRNQEKGQVAVFVKVDAFAKYVDLLYNQAVVGRKTVDTLEELSRRIMCEVGYVCYSTCIDVHLYSYIIYILTLFTFHLIPV